MTFPVSPTNGEVTTVNSITYTYNATDNAWSRVAQPIGNLTVSGNVSVGRTLSIDNTGDVSANIGAYQIYANANAATQATSINTINANLGTATTNITTLFANAATQATSINTINANLGTATTNITTLFANAATQSVNINSLATGANANTAAYLPSVTTLAGLTSFGAVATTTTAQGSLTVVGNLTIQGNTLTIGSNNLTVTDSIIDLHTFANLAPLVSNDGRDVGIRFHYYKTSDKHAFIGWENATETLTYYQDATEVDGVVTGTLGNVELGSLYVSNTTASTSTTTGALQVRGGAGIAGNINVTTGQYVDVSGGSGTRIARDAAANGLTLQTGGVSQLFVADSTGNVVVNSTTATTSTTTGALIVKGGVGIADNINVGGTTNYFAGNVGVGQSLVAGWYGQQPMMVVSKSQNAETIFGIGNPTVGASAAATLRIIGGTANSYHISGINDNNGAPVYKDDMGTGILHRQWTTAGTERLKLTSAGNLVITATTATTDSTTGAFVVRGGVGIAGNVEVGTTGASAIRAGAFVTNVLNLDPGSGNIAVRFGKGAIASGTGIIGWNRSGGAGEMSFVQNKNGGSSGGFIFYDWANTAINSTTAVFGISGTGNVTVYGNITPNANLTYNLGSPTAWYNTFYGVSTQAKYADLAENYVGDVEYAPGTVVVFGGTEEVTVTTVSHDTRVAGVVSTNPAYLMNSMNGNVAVAMTGRVPCRVQGPVEKGTVLVSSHIPGVAEALNSGMYRPGCVIGKALEQIDSTHIMTIEVVVGRF